MLVYLTFLTNHTSVYSKCFFIADEMVQPLDPYTQRDRPDIALQDSLTFDKAMFELTKIELFLLNATLLKAMLRFASQSDLTSDVRELPTLLNFSTSLIPSIFAVRLNIGGPFLFAAVISLHLMTAPVSQSFS